MSDPNPGVSFGGNIKDSTIIVGDLNRVGTSNEQCSNATCSSERAASDSVSKTFSVVERRRLRQTLNALPLGLFEELVYDLAIPAGVLPVKGALQRNRCQALLEWAEKEKGPGLQAIEERLMSVVFEQDGIAQKHLAFVISRKVSRSTLLTEVQAFVQLLKQATGDDSIEMVFYEKASISTSIILSGSSDGLKQLQHLYESGELVFLDMPSVENVQPVENYTAVARKARLVESLRLRRGLEFFLDRAHTNAFVLYLYLSLSLDRDLDRAIDRVRAIGLDRTLDRAIARALARARDRAIDRAIDRALSLDRDLALDRDLDLDLAHARALARALDLALTLVRDLTLARSHALTLARHLVQVLDRDRAIDRAIDLAFNLAFNLDLDPVSIYDLDLTDADLRRTNLININLVGVDLTGSDLMGADVLGTIFGDNNGLLEAVKCDLKKRGAIFQDSPGSNVPNLVRV